MHLSNLSTCLCLHLSVYLFISVYMTFHLFACIWLLMSLSAFMYGFWLSFCLSIYLSQFFCLSTLGVHSHIRAAGDSGIPMSPGSCWGSRRDAIAFKSPEAGVPPVGNWRSCLIVAVTLHFEMVVSGGVKWADLQRVGILSSLRGFSIIIIIIMIIIWCFILCERQFFYKNSLALSTNQNKSHNITIYTRYFINSISVWPETCVGIITKFLILLAFNKPTNSSVYGFEAGVSSH